MTAKAATEATMPMMREMVATLLADRFKLTFHRDTKQLATLNLVVAKGDPKLRVSQQDGPGILTAKSSAMVAKHATMEEFVKTRSAPGARLFAF